MSNSWKRAILQLTLAVGVVAFVGWLIGHTFIVLFLAGASYAAWHLFNLYRLERWLYARKRTNPPDIPGLWTPSLYQIHRLLLKNQKRKRHFSQLLREFRKSTTAMPDGTVILNEKNQIEWFNRAAGVLIGLNTRRDTGQRIDNLIRNPRFIQYLEESNFSESLELQSPVNEEIRITVQLVRYGRRDQRLLLIKDVTRLANLERTRRDFVANASHELRSPLTVIAGYLETMAGDHTLSEEWRQPIGQMRQQTQNMTAIVRDLLELSRLESLKTTAPRRVVEIGELIEEVRLEALALEPDASIQVKLETSVKLLGLRSELHSIFSNLLSNAVKFSMPDAKIRVRWYLESDGVCLAVEDNGIGIPEEDIPRLTERFYRVDAGRSREAGGTGLGLAITKHALGRHGATMEISSELGKGSVFSCHFPHDRIHGPAQRPHLRAV
ncbi:MAG: phosphate regulon sensor histidine kinase PhoR [Pseudomonadota bacterium]